jgi:hypothetical protein
MTGGILLTGGCYLVTAVGLSGVRAPARALLIAAGVAGIGIAASPEPTSGATPRHLAWTVLGAITTAVWPAFAARRTSPRPLILSSYGSAAVTAVFVALLGWLLIETRDGSVLGLAERLTSSIQTCWPFIVAVALRRTRSRPAAHAQPERPAPGARSSPSYPAGALVKGAAHVAAPGCLQEEVVEHLALGVIERSEHLVVDRGECALGFEFVEQPDDVRPVHLQRARERLLGDARTPLVPGTRNGLGPGVLLHTRQISDPDARGSGAPDQDKSAVVGTAARLGLDALDQVGGP